MRTRNAALHDKKRAEIVTAATECFIARGFHQTGMQDICAAAGMSPGALYRYFPSKRKIIEALAEQERALNRKWLSDLATATHVVKGLEAVISDLAPLLADRTSARLTLEVGAEAARNAEVASIFADSDDEVRDSVISALRRGQQQGDVRDDLDVSAAAHLLVALLDGLLGRAAFPLPIGRKNLVAAARDLVRRYLSP
jgi:TetR/AcrR family transcriptional regulator, repressor for uid operon